ncbi:MAG: AAA family ATPase [Christensenellaceae bacterium]|nr:AAA family ATPase [Christensenellaceae bacterium]
MTRRAILLNGPSSSGKSTLARALRQVLLKDWNGVWDIVSIDDHLKMTADEAIEEDDVYAVSPMICADALKALDAGHGVIVDHVITSGRIFRQTMDALRGAQSLLVHVTCSREELIRREAARKNRCPGSAEASFDYLFPQSGYDLTVDTTAQPPEDMAVEILSCL